MVGGGQGVSSDDCSLTCVVSVLCVLCFDTNSESEMKMMCIVASEKTLFLKETDGSSCFGHLKFGQIGIPHGTISVQVQSLLWASLCHSKGDTAKAKGGVK